MSCPGRRLKYGTILPVVAALAVAGFFVPPIVRPSDPGDPGQGLHMWGQLPTAPMAAVPAAPVVLPPAIQLDVHPGKRPGWTRTYGRGGSPGIGPRRAPVRLTQQADGGRSRSGPGGGERQARAGRLTAPSTAPPLLRNRGA